MAISGTDLLEVPTICKAYFSGLCKGISPENMALYGTDPEIPIDGKVTDRKTSQKKKIGHDR